MNKKSVFFFVFLLILYTFIPAATAEQQDWYIAYYDYIMLDEYLQSGQKFVRNGDNAYEMPCFCLFDMNRDGTPELLISNSDYTHAGGRTYLFSFQNNRVEVPEGAMNVSLGMHDTQYYYPNRPDYPGIFTGEGGMGYYYHSYYSFDWNVLKEDDFAETIYVPPDDPYGWLDEPRYIKKTKDDVLYQLFRDENEKKGSLLFWSKSEIIEKGWDAFVKEMTGIDVNSPLIEPAEGDRIDLWESDFLPVRWKSVEGAITYRFTVKCSWTLLNGKNAVETIYSTFYDIEPDSAGKEYTLNIPMTDIERSLLPRYTDLNAWVILTVTK